MSTHAIAQRYAKALIQIALKQQSVEQYYDELQDVRAALESSPGVMNFMLDPAIGVESKREVVKDIAKKIGVSKTVGDFILLLLDKKRLDALRQIMVSYRAFADEAAGILRSTITSAFPLTEAQVTEMSASLEKLTGKKIVLDVVTDATLIGGVVTLIGDKVLDGSIRTQLAKIQDILQKG